MSRSGQTPAGRQVGVELRSLREQTGRTVAETAANLGWSESKLSRIETANTRISDADLGSLLNLYRVDEGDQARISRLVGQARRQIKRTPYGEALPDVLETFIGLETQADAILTYGAIVVPGLLQTPEYAGAIARATRALEDEVAADRVITRMARQAILARRPPLTLRVVIDEAVLRRPVGGPEIMRGQMLRLIEASGRATTSIQVLPLSVGAHPAVTGQFAVLEFGQGTVPAHVFCDGLTGGVLRSGEEDVRRYRSCFEALTKIALGHNESVSMISLIAEGDHD